MAEASVVYIYRQHFGEGQEPFTKKFHDTEILSHAKQAFYEFGGRKIVDVQISNHETWRISYWQNADGYTKWQRSEKVHEYIFCRENYNKQNNILTDLWGPFSADEIFVEKT